MPFVLILVIALAAGAFLAMLRYGYNLSTMKFIICCTAVAAVIAAYCGTGYISYAIVMAFVTIVGIANL